MPQPDSRTSHADLRPRRYPIGAELPTPDLVSLRVWAPDHEHVSVHLDGHPTPMSPEPDGYWSAVVPGRPGSRYGFQLGDDETLCPDPASRSQPDGPHGLSAVVDPAAFAWRDESWTGPDAEDGVIYEMHVGTFTPEGTFRAAEAHLAELAELGVSVLQLMPVAEAPGRFGWGYDGVHLFAPSHRYGTPDDLRHFVDVAHQLGLAVILDVVYNHIGPDGNYLPRFSADYFTERYANEWGDAINFDGPRSGPVREWVLTNVAYWVDEFHLDGFRLDATQQIFDSSDEHLVAAIARTARTTAGDRTVLVFAENEPQDSQLFTPSDEGGYGLDAIYNEDFHHSARVSLVGTCEAYLSDYRGTASEWFACARHGALFQGQFYRWQQRNRGTPAGAPGAFGFVTFLENHDQVANGGHGHRLIHLARPSELRAMTALLLLMPSRPMLFQGQEFGATTHFRYFADHTTDLAEAVARGRREFLQQFARLRDPETFADEPEPHEDATFTSSILRRDANDPSQAAWRAFVHDAIALRRRRPRHEGALTLDGAAPFDSFLILRYRGDGDSDWLILLNRGADRDVAGLSEPLIAPPRHRRWRMLWSSEAPRYGGLGTMVWHRGHWPVPANALIVMEAMSPDAVQ